MLVCIVTEAQIRIMLLTEMGYASTPFLPNPVKWFVLFPVLLAGGNDPRSFVFCFAVRAMEYLSIAGSRSALLILLLIKTYPMACPKYSTAGRSFLVSES